MCVACQRAYNADREYHKAKLRERYARCSAEHIADCTARRRRKAAAKAADRDAFRVEHGAVLQAARDAMAELRRRDAVWRATEWGHKNLAKRRARTSRGNFKRRVSMRAACVALVPAEFLIAQRALQNDRCAYCKCDLRGAGHQDHIIPVSKGGLHTPANIVWACERCNLQKGSKLDWTPDCVLQSNC